jgi:hypothetical protein
MSKNKKYMLANVSLLLLLGVFVFHRPPEVAAQANKAPQQVQVVNPPTSPALVVNTPSTPISTRTIMIAEEGNGGTFAVAYTVPGGKHLVIEFASGAGSVGAGQGMFFTIRTFDSLGSPISNVFAGTALPGGTTVVGSQQMRLYAYSGNVAVEFTRTNTFTGGASAIIALSGYLVDN